MSGKVYIVGIGPGGRGHMSVRAIEVIENADIVIGYRTYIDILKASFKMKKAVSSGMTKETERCIETLRLAEEGNEVALVSSGDPGIYGMAGLMLEIVNREKSGVKFEVVPGITSLSAAGAILGAPVMHDYASISLSDLLTDWELIKTRLEAASRADFVICIYNPKSKTRTSHIAEARDIILKYRDKKTPVGIVRNAMRDNESCVITDLENMLDHEIDMLTTIIVGNSDTYVALDRMITPRGYSV